MVRTARSAVAQAVFAVHQCTPVTCTREEYIKYVREAIRQYAEVRAERNDAYGAKIACAYIHQLDRQFGIETTNSR
jgi:hypothetical protein